MFFFFGAEFLRQKAVEIGNDGEVIDQRIRSAVENNLAQEVPTRAQNAEHSDQVTVKQVLDEHSAIYIIILVLEPSANFTLGPPRTMFGVSTDSS